MSAVIDLLIAEDVTFRLSPPHLPLQDLPDVWTSVNLAAVNDPEKQCQSLGLSICVIYLVAISLARLGHEVSRASSFMFSASFFASMALPIFFQISICSLSLILSPRFPLLPLSLFSSFVILFLSLSLSLYIQYIYITSFISLPEAICIRSASEGASDRITRSDNPAVLSLSLPQPGRRCLHGTIRSSSCFTSSSPVPPWPFLITVVYSDRLCFLEKRMKG